MDVFPSGSSSPTIYRDFNFVATLSLGYDRQDNLFVDGTDQNSAFHYAELPAGAEAFTDITLNGFTGGDGAGGVQWDGTYMAIGNGFNYIFRTQGPNVVGATLLSGTSCVESFFIVPAKHVVVAPDECNATVGEYPYPAGGAPIKIIASGFSQPWGAVISR